MAMPLNALNRSRIDRIREIVAIRKRENRPVNYAAISRDMGMSERAIRNLAIVAYRHGLLSPIVAGEDEKRRKNNETRDRLKALRAETARLGRPLHADEFTALMG